MYEGTCLNGPLAGHMLASRKPAGALVMDMPARLVWWYAWQPDDGVFVALDDGNPRPLAEGPADGPGDSRYRAIVEPYWDVVAAPWVGADDPDDDGGDDGGEVA